MSAPEQINALQKSHVSIQIPNSPSPERERRKNSNCKAAAKSTHLPVHGRSSKQKKKTETMSREAKRTTVLEVGDDGVALITIVNPPVNALTADSTSSNPFPASFDLSNVVTALIGFTVLADIFLLVGVEFLRVFQLTIVDTVISKVITGDDGVTLLLSTSLSF